MFYDDALKFFKDNLNYAKPDENPIDYNFAQGLIALVETIDRDMREIKSKLDELRRKMS